MKRREFITLTRRRGGGVAACVAGAAERSGCGHRILPSAATFSMSAHWVGAFLHSDCTISAGSTAATLRSTSAGRGPHPTEFADIVAELVALKHQTSSLTYGAATVCSRQAGDTRRSRSCSRSSLIQSVPAS